MRQEGETRARSKTGQFVSPRGPGEPETPAHRLRFLQRAPAGRTNRQRLRPNQFRPVERG